MIECPFCELKSRIQSISRAWLQKTWWIRGVMRILAIIPFSATVRSPGILTDAKLSLSSFLLFLRLLCDDSCCRTTHTFPLPLLSWRLSFYLYLFLPAAVTLILTLLLLDITYSALLATFALINVHLLVIARAFYLKISPFDFFTDASSLKQALFYLIENYWQLLNVSCRNSWTLDFGIMLYNNTCQPGKMFVHYTQGLLSCKLRDSLKLLANLLMRFSASLVLSPSLNLDDFMAMMEILALLTTNNHT